MFGGWIEVIVCLSGLSLMIYVGVGLGSVWKLENFGIIWWFVFEYEVMGVIGDIVVLVLNFEIVWVGMGEVLLVCLVFLGMGVYKSEDGGEFWINMGLYDLYYIGWVCIYLSDLNMVYVVVIGY